MAFGQSGESYVDEIREMIAVHPQDLGAYLSDQANAAAKERMRTLQGALYDYVASFATPRQKNQIGRGLVDLINEYPQYFRLQSFDLEKQPGMPSLAVQIWLTLLMVKYDDPAARRVLADAAQLTGGYRKLVEEIGLIYADNAQNPRGAEAIYQWVRTIPREIYPGTCITANDWLGGRTFLVRGHMKDTFNGHPVDRGEYGFGEDARQVIGQRGSENWFMTVVCHKACHDLDAYVRQRPGLNRRWGQTLVLAGGPDMRADADTGWLSWERTKQHFRETGLWNGRDVRKPSRGCCLGRRGRMNSADLVNQIRSCVGVRHPTHFADCRFLRRSRCDRRAQQARHCGFTVVEAHAVCFHLPRTCSPIHVHKCSLKQIFYSSNL